MSDTIHTPLTAAMHPGVKSAPEGTTPLTTTWCVRCGKRAAYQNGLCLPCIKDPKPVPKEKAPMTTEKTCNVPHCTKAPQARGLCATHWNQWRDGKVYENGSPVPPEKRSEAQDASAAARKQTRKQKYTPPTQVKTCRDCGKPALNIDGKPARVAYCLDCYAARVAKGKKDFKKMDERCNAERAEREAAMHSHAEHGNAGAANSATTAQDGRKWIPQMVELDSVGELPDNVEYLAIPMHGHPEYYRIIAIMAEIHGAKNQDYGAGDPLGNFRESAKLGIDPFHGALIRMSDKYARVMSLARPNATAQVKTESIEDTLKDLANYAILSLVLLREGNSKDAGGHHENR